MYKKKSARDGAEIDGTFISSGTGINVKRELFKRSAIQATGDYNLNVRNLTDSADREEVVLYDLNSATGFLEGPKLRVFTRGSGEEGDPTPPLRPAKLSKWPLGQTIPWNTKDFESYMVYAHGSRALNYMKQLFPKLNYGVNGRPMLPLEAFSSVNDSPLLTRYRINTSGKPGTVLF